MNQGKSRGRADAVRRLSPVAWKAQRLAFGDTMLTFLFLVLLVVGGVIAYRNRVPLIAKITGQKESRIRRALEQRKRG